MNQPIEVELKLSFFSLSLSLITITHQNMDENVTLSQSDSDDLNSSIGSRSGSIDKPGIWVWLADHLNKRRSSKKDITDLSDTKAASPETIGRSLFYLSSSWNPIELVGHFSTQVSVFSFPFLIKQSLSR